MVALLLSVGMFVYLGIVGYALVALTAGRPDDRLVLFSPTLGAAVVTLAVMFVNYLGVPVKSFGLPLAVFLLLVSIGIIARTKYRVFSRSVYVIAGIVLAALFLSGRPLLEFGFDWLSFANSDMDTYVHGAARIFEHGFLTGPQTATYVQNRDAVQVLYELNVLLNNRSGVENLLAFGMAAFGLDGYHTYMPLILALQSALICATTALVCGRATSSYVPLATAAVAGASALVTLGSDLQLIAQVAGLALMVAALSFLCTLDPRWPLRSFVGHAVLCAVPVAALAAVYPEVVPVLAVAVALFFAVALLRRNVGFMKVITWFAAVGAVVLVLLNFHLSTCLNMIALTLKFGNATGGPTKLFPQYLVPSGVAHLFGLSPIALSLKEPVLSITIALGLALLAVTVVAVVLMMIRQQIAAFGCFALLLVIVALARSQNGFGLYKAAMYLQPFLIPTLVRWWGDRSLSARPVPDIAPS